MGRHHRVLQRRPERNTRRGAREGWLGGRAARRLGEEGAGPIRTQQFTRKKKKPQVVQWAPEENQVREVPEAAGASSTATASRGSAAARGWAGLAWRGPQHTLVPS